MDYFTSDYILALAGDSDLFDQPKDFKCDQLSVKTILQIMKDCNKFQIDQQIHMLDAIKDCIDCDDMESMYEVATSFIGSRNHTLCRFYENDVDKYVKENFVPVKLVIQNGYYELSTEGN